jgi:KNOX1 domain
MEDLYSIHPGIAIAISTHASHASHASHADGDLSSLHQKDNAHLDEQLNEKALKAQIAAHPRYSSLLSAYIHCRKVKS